jgi:hypothetical protein
MNLTAHYDSMRQAAVRGLAQREAELDNLIDSPHDHRRGITLLARPPATITARIEEMLADFRRVEPDQYYYPASDIHVTILSIISCYQGFALDLIDSTAYQNAVRSILQSSVPFSIRFAGLTASPGSLIVQGFPMDDGLENLRAATRSFFRSSGLHSNGAFDGHALSEPAAKPGAAAGEAGGVSAPFYRLVCGRFGRADL